MILWPKNASGFAATRKPSISVMTHRSTGARAASSLDILLRAAITQSSIAVAVCDPDFTIWFFNPAIAALLDRAAAETPAVAGELHGMEMLRVLGVDEAEAMSHITLRGSWHGIARFGTLRDPAPGSQLHVAIEAFRENDRKAGWLMSARESFVPSPPVRLSDQALIAMSGKLTSREREVMLALREGSSNKAIALRLQISPRTVEFHRARIMQRFDAKSVVDLVRRVTSDARATLPAEY